MPFGDFVKKTLPRVIHCASSHSVKNMTRLYFHYIHWRSKTKLEQSRSS